MSARRRGRLGWTAVFAALVLAFAAPAGAQGGREPRVTAQLRRGVLKLGETVALIVTIENSVQCEILEVPSVDGLEIGAPGSARVSHVYINGRSLSSRSWAIMIRPLAVGRYEIPPLRLRVDGEERTTRPLPLVCEADLVGSDLGFLEFRPSSRTVVEGQRFGVELEFGWDEGIGRPHVALSLPWWGEIPGVLEIETPPRVPQSKLAEIPLNGRGRVLIEEREPRVIDGRRFRVFQLRKRFVATRPGRVDFGQSFLEFGPTYEERGLFGTTLKKQASYYVSAPEFSLPVTELPREGRPADYGGAIGTIDVRAAVAPRNVPVGGTIRLQVTWSGEGNFEFFDLPDPSADFAGFRVFEPEDHKGPDTRTAIYELTPLSADLTAIPPLGLPVFDPELGEYVRVETAPITIEVQALADAVDLASEPEPDAVAEERRVALRPPPADPGRPRDTRPLPAGLVAGGLALPPLAWALLRFAVARASDEELRRRRRSRRALRALEGRLARATTARTQQTALHAFLADRADESPEAWEGRDARDWCAEHGVDASAAAELQGLLATLDRAVWSAGTGAPAAADADGRRAIRELAARLQESGL